LRAHLFCIHTCSSEIRRMNIVAQFDMDNNQLYIQS
jgi:hypothetical protein